ncbi:MAG: hypothetical protein JKY89_02440 [Immundisolibacteraceae bacterium]|nr:hypothetical protein [Immundisolibacteraceae bacterium]
MAASTTLSTSVPLSARRPFSRQLWGWFLSLMIALAPATPAFAKLSISADGPHCIQILQAQVAAESMQHQHHRQIAVADSQRSVATVAKDHGSVEMDDCCNAGNDCGDCSVSQQSLISPPLGLSFHKASSVIVVISQPSTDALPLLRYRPPAPA